MNWLERKFLRFGWGRMMKAWPAVRRWAPLIGTFGLAASVIVRALGLTEVANLLDALTGVTGLDEQSPVSRADLAFTVAACAGILMKIHARRKAIVAEAYLEARPEEAKEAAVKEVLAPPPIALDASGPPAKPADVQAVKDVLRAKGD